MRWLIACLVLILSGCALDSAPSSEHVCGDPHLPWPKTNAGDWRAGMDGTAPGDANVDGRIDIAIPCEVTGVLGLVFNDSDHELRRWPYDIVGLCPACEGALLVDIDGDQVPDPIGFPQAENAAANGGIRIFFNRGGALDWSTQVALPQSDVSTRHLGGLELDLWGDGGSAIVSAPATSTVYAWRRLPGADATLAANWSRVELARLKHVMSLHEDELGGDPLLPEVVASQRYEVVGTTPQPGLYILPNAGTWPVTPIAITPPARIGGIACRGDLGRGVEEYILPTLGGATSGGTSPRGLFVYERPEDPSTWVGPWPEVSLGYPAALNGKDPKGCAVIDLDGPEGPALPSIIVTTAPSGTTPVGSLHTVWLVEQAPAGVWTWYPIGQVGTKVDDPLIIDGDVYVPVELPASGLMRLRNPVGCE